MAVDAEALRDDLAEARSGSRAAADRLIRSHDGWVRSAIYAVTGRSDQIDDIAQQVWTRVWERLTTLENPQQWRSWLYTIARNAAIDHSVANRRRASMNGRLPDGELPAPERLAPRPERWTSDGELQRTLLDAVQALPATYREPFVLRHLNDWGYAEIGEVLGLSTDAVETRLVRARAMLREMLAGKVDEPC